MTAWSAFYPELLPHVMGCPDPMMDQALRRAAQELLQKTRAWRLWLDPVASLVGVREYDLDLPSDVLVVRIERATLNGTPFDALSYKDQASDYSRADQDGMGLVSQDRVSFTLTRLLPAGSLLAVYVSLMPGAAATGVPDDIFNQHSEDILAGAKARLMLTPGVDWYRPDLAVVARGQFDAAIASKAAQAWRGFTGATPRPRVRFL